ncbi:TPA: site-specific integrase [Clostridioides difficile]|nr:site-specific integrase [Clostridioides difficile]HBF6292150.1 site-specific integrase [Clostridioides difficile]HBY2691107.1 site-specific integrase [Clostridioides difficile]
MATKRANGEGSIVKNIRNGVQIGWRASISIGRDEKGKLIRKQFTGKTQKEVKEKLDIYRTKMLLGSIVSADKITFEDWFYTWLFDYRAKDLKPKSFERYEGIYRNYIKDTELGKIKLIDLRATHIQRYYNKLMDVYNKPASTIITLNTRLKPCLTEAEKQGYIQKNYCKMVTLPSDNKIKEVQILSITDQKKFIDSIDGDKFEILFLLALSTGLRLGELLGLKWSDISFDDESLTVNRTLQRVTEIKKDGTREKKIIEQYPKTKNSIRTVPIPRNILVKLKRHKIQQTEQRLLLGDAYINNNYVICNDTGLALNNNRPGKILDSLLKKLNIPKIKFHALRHTYATRLFEAGVPPKTVQMLMGHYDISITMDIYTHVMHNTKQDAVDKINDIF